MVSAITWRSMLLGHSWESPKLMLRCDVRCSRTKSMWTVRPRTLYRSVSRHIIFRDYWCGAQRGTDWWKSRCRLFYKCYSTLFHFISLLKQILVNFTTALTHFIFKNVANVCESWPMLVNWQKNSSDDGEISWYLKKRAITECGA